jgi:hypothetical protein
MTERAATAAELVKELGKSKRVPGLGSPVNIRLKSRYCWKKLISAYGNLTLALNQSFIPMKVFLINSY